ncbi:MAG: MiaB/RimO family radical SAM methylthiotransferase [Chloroflexota bacterium]|nr:MiaB/RimO family radical SAM methylthiotransferase [Chloroflexota bacterium]
MKVYLDTVGCRLNQSEIETYAREFRAAGHSIVAVPAEADLTVVNTCTVTVAAAADSRKKIRRAARAGCGKIIATGCWATLEASAAQSLPGVSQVIPNLEKERLVPKILQVDPEMVGGKLSPRKPIPGPRSRTRAFIKAQDGCDNGCTFCITTVARGAGRSRAVVDVLADIRAAHDGGVQEAVLTGVHLGSWGQDFNSPQSLRDLIENILSATKISRLRISSLEPWDLDAEFFSLWEDERLARQLHLPLQSGCSATLRRMARKTSPDEYANLVGIARSAIPDVAITTDVIAGFPGESEVEFEESLAFVRGMNFAGGHVFTYSARPGTAAARMSGQVPHPIRKSRNAKMRAVFASAAKAYQSRFLGQCVSVLWESATELDSGDWALKGLSDNYLRVTAQSPERLWNRITDVVISGMREHGLFGEVQNAIDRTPSGMLGENRCCFAKPTCIGW